MFDPQGACTTHAQPLGLCHLAHLVSHPTRASNDKLCSMIVIDYKNCRLPPNPPPPPLGDSQYGYVRPAVAASTTGDSGPSLSKASASSEQTELVSTRAVRSQENDGGAAAAGGAAGGEEAQHIRAAFMICCPAIHEAPRPPWSC